MYYVKMFLFFPFLLSVFVQKSRATLLINQMLSQDKKKTTCVFQRQHSFILTGHRDYFTGFSS